LLSGKPTCVVLQQHAATQHSSSSPQNKQADIGDGYRVAGKVLVTSATIVSIQFVSDQAANWKRSNKIWQ